MPQNESVAGGREDEAKRNLREKSQEISDFNSFQIQGMPSPIY